MIIYKTTNNVNGKIYIGKDKKNNPKYLGSGKILKQAITKYGRESFTKEIIEECEDEKIWLEREKYWIEYFNAIKLGYNIALGGSGGDTISNHPNRDEIRKKHSEKMKDPKINKNKEKGRKLIIKKRDDPNWVNPRLGKESPLIGRSNGRKGISNPVHSEWMKENNPMKGKTHSDEIKKFLREINQKPKKEEHKNKISESAPNNKKCIIEGVEYRSVAYASKVLGVSENTVRGRVKNKNFKNWSYE